MNELSLYDDFELPHIQKVNAENKTLFGIYRGNPDILDELIGHEDRGLDLEIAWGEFDRISYKEFFKEIAAEPELLYDPSTRRKIFDRIKPQWQINYYLKFLVKKGVADVIPMSNGDVYFFKEQYKAAIREVLAPKDPEAESAPQPAEPSLPRTEP